MKRTILTAAVAIAAAGCAAIQQHRTPANPYEKPQFYSKYLAPNGNSLDAAIQHDLDRLMDNPNDAAVHNDLGQLLVRKGFPKDAELEFRRSIRADKKFYPAWYNLGLVQAARDEWGLAQNSFESAVHYKPGYSEAIFQLGLMSEKAGHTEDAVRYYAKAISINRQLLDVRVNPRVLDSKLVDLALIQLYPTEHTRDSMVFQATPLGYQQPVSQQQQEAPSPQAPAAKIVTPAAPITNPATQTPPPNPKQ